MTPPKTSAADADEAFTLRFWQESGCETDDGIVWRAEITQLKETCQTNFRIAVQGVEQASRLIAACWRGTELPEQPARSAPANMQIACSDRSNQSRKGDRATQVSEFRTRLPTILRR